MPEIDRITAAAADYRTSYTPADLGPAPSRAVAVVACMDARLDLFRMLGLEVGDAHLVRNAGGLVTDDALRSLVLSQRALGTRQTLLVHHTDCGLHKLEDDPFLDELERETGVRPAWTPGGFADPFEDVARSLEVLRGCPWLVSTDARGFVFDVDTGELVEVGA